MNKKLKIGFGIATTLLAVGALTGCTKSFCSNLDSGRMMFAFEPGLTKYEAGGEEEFFSQNKAIKIANVKVTVATWKDSNDGFAWGDKDVTYLNEIISTSKKNGYITVDKNSIQYFTAMDALVMQNILNHISADYPNSSEQSPKVFDLSNEDDFSEWDRAFSKYSYLKFIEADDKTMWEQYEAYDAIVRKTVPSDYCPSTDFYGVYKSKLNTYVQAYRTCLTTKTDKYGTYGYSANGIYVEAKNWGDAWGKGFFEGLLVYPIGWLIDQITFGFRSTGMSTGAAAFLGIIFITLIVRSLMLLATWKQTTGNAKMTALQPEIQKIQNKYPNANTSRVEKQRMAEEMQRLYRKNKINPFMTIIVMIIQFPVFICVWGALSGSAVLADGTILGLNLTMSIREAMFNGANWGAAGNYAAVTALFLFLFMAAAQTVSMLLPQIIQKRKAKKVAKLGKNPAQKSQNSQMKIFTYVMLAMIIFMGFSLVSAMGLYWFVGALFSIGQTLLTQWVLAKKAKKQ